MGYAYGLLLLVVGMVAVTTLACASPAATQTPTPTAAPTPTSGPSQGWVNVGATLRLCETSYIALYEFTPSGSFLRTVIDDPRTVEQIVSGLDASLPLQPRVRCIPQYRAHFVLTGGDRAVLSLACDPQPAWMRGDQAFWLGQDAQLPDGVRNAVLAAASGAPEVQPSVADEVVQEVVGRLVQAHPALERHAAYDWQRLEVGPKLMGASQMVYVSTEWVVWVRWTVTLEPVFTVEAMAPSAGFTWHGSGPKGAIVAAGESMKTDVSCADFERQPARRALAQVQVGERFTVTLCSNASTGFQWGPPSISDTGVVTLIDHAHLPPAGPTPMPGAPGADTWTFEAVGRGRSAISFSYSQPWEGGTKGAWTLLLDVSAAEGRPADTAP